MVLSIDAEKAFDKVDWDFMMETIKELGIGPRMIRWIGSLYMNPSASVKVNGNLSPQFKMQNGTRQGCPLSPLLFVLTLEPLLGNIRNNPDIGGVKIGLEEHKVAAYADDILLYCILPILESPSRIL